VASDAEITIECNPGTVSDTKFAVYKEAGINRLSIGLQSANNDELKTLGRIHTYEQFLMTFDKARHHGFNNINVDLMSALPGRTPEGFIRSLKKIIRLKPEHISAYSLIIEEGTPFYEKYQKDVELRESGCETMFLPTEEEEYQTTKQTQELLQSEGYHWYEISNFARKGMECRHNLGYWQRKNYMGFGIGAASLMENVRFKNGESIKDYLEDPCGCRCDVEELTVAEQMEETMFLGLRMSDGVSFEKFKVTFGRDLYDVYGDVICKHVSEELLEIVAGKSKEGSEDKFVRLTRKGMDVSNYVMADFLEP
jgi:oxygen-independent coproporphyrinogen-3 oxidase